MDITVEDIFGLGRLILVLAVCALIMLVLVESKRVSKFMDWLAAWSPRKRIRSFHPLSPLLVRARRIIRHLLPQKKMTTH